MASSSSSSGGIGFVGLLTIVFITLKLTGHITWPWIWVLSPLWIGFALVLCIFALIMGIALLTGGRRRSRW
jgi:hypothetical protein